MLNINKLQCVFKINGEGRVYLSKVSTFSWGQYKYSPIPLSEIDIIWVKKANVLATLGVIWLGIAVTFVILAAQVLKTGMMNVKWWGVR